MSFSSGILHLDWDIGSSLAVVNSNAYELKFIDPINGVGVRSSSTKGVEWASWTCKLGFPVQGIWQGVDYSDVNTVCRNAGQTCLSTGSDDQVVRLFKYPTVIDRQIHR